MRKSLLKEEKRRRIKTRSMGKKNKEKEIKMRFQGRLTRGRLQALEEEIRRHVFR